MKSRAILVTWGVLLSFVMPAVVTAQSVNEISSPAGTGAAEPFLSSADGHLLLSWLEPRPDTKRVALRFARFAAGKWSAAQTIAEREDFFVNWADFPSIVADAKGVLFAHWLQMSAAGKYTYDVRMSISSDAGKTWGEPFLLNRDGKRVEHGFVTLIPLPGAGVGATWLDGRNMAEGEEGGNMSVRYATVDRRGVIRSGVEVDGRTCECCTTGMTMASGRPVIAYRDRSPEEVRDIAVVRQTSKGWSKPRLLYADGWKIAGCPVNGPQIAASGRNVAAAWFTASNEQPQAYVAFSTNAGATFSAPVRIDDGKPVGRVDVVMLDAETAVVSWSEQTANGAELRVRRVQRNHAADPFIKVADSNTTRAAGFARAAAIGRDVYVTWTEQNAATKKIHVARVHF